MRARDYLFVLGLLLSVAAYCTWVPPMLAALPADYVAETGFLLESRYRPSLTSPFQHSHLTGRRMDQTLVATGSVAIVQGNVRWDDGAGLPVFETTGIYGLDRNTRTNLGAYGDIKRSGQYLFPMHTEARSYTLWDPIFIGLRRVDFLRHDRIGEVPVLVFRFVGTGLDESTGYANMPDVPERYRALTDGSGTLWVEPVSGIVVDYNDQGRSYLSAPAGGLDAGDFHFWIGKFDDATRAERLQAARAVRRQVFWHERGIPAAMLAVGGAALLWRRAAGKRGRP